jgi:hypothetical protein
MTSVVLYLHDQGISLERPQTSSSEPPAANLGLSSTPRLRALRRGLWSTSREAETVLAWYLLSEPSNVLISL